MTKETRKSNGGAQVTNRRICQQMAPPMPKVRLRQYPPLTNFSRITSYRDKPKTSQQCRGSLTITENEEWQQPQLNYRGTTTGKSRSCGLNFPCKLLLEKDGTTIRLEGADEYLKDYKHILFSQKNKDGTLGVYLVPNDDSTQRKMFAVIPTAPDNMEYAGWEIDGNADQKYLTPVFKPRETSNADKDTSKETKRTTDLSTKNPVLSRSLFVNSREGKVNGKGNDDIEVIDLCDDDKDSCLVTSVKQSPCPETMISSSSSGSNYKTIKKDVRPMFLFSNYAAANLARSAVKEIDSDKHLYKIDLKSSFKPSMIQKPLSSTKTQQQTLTEEQQKVGFTDSKSVTDTLRATIPGLKNADENRTQYLKPLPTLGFSTVVRSSAQTTASYIPPTSKGILSSTSVTFSQSKSLISKAHQETKSTQNGEITTPKVLPPASVLTKLPWSSLSSTAGATPVSSEPLVVAPVFQPFVLSTKPLFQTPGVNTQILAGSSHVQGLTSGVSTPILAGSSHIQGLTSGVSTPILAGSSRVQGLTSGVSTPILAGSSHIQGLTSGVSAPILAGSSHVQGLTSGVSAPILAGSSHVQGLTSGVSAPILAGSSHIQGLTPTLYAPVLPTLSPVQVVTSGTHASGLMPLIQTTQASGLKSVIPGAAVNLINQSNPSKITQLRNNNNTVGENQNRNVTTVFPSDIRNLNMATSVPVLASSVEKTAGSYVPQQTQSVPLIVSNSRQICSDLVVHTLPDVVTLNTPTTVRLSSGKNFGTVESGQHLVYVAQGRSSPQIVQLRKVPECSDAKSTFFSPVTESANIQLSQPPKQSMSNSIQQKTVTELRTTHSTILFSSAPVQVPSNPQKTSLTTKILGNTTRVTSVSEVPQWKPSPCQSSLHTLQSLRSKVISENQGINIPNIDFSNLTFVGKDTRPIDNRSNVKTQSVNSNSVTVYGNLSSESHKQASVQRHDRSQETRSAVNDDSSLDIRIGTVFSLATTNDTHEQSTKREVMCSMSDRSSFDVHRPWLTRRTRMPLHEVLFWNETQKLKLPRTAVADKRLRRKCAVVLSRCSNQSLGEDKCSKKCRERVIIHQEERLSKVNNLKKLRRSLYLKLKLRLFPKPSGVVSNLRSATSTAPPKRYVEDDLTTDIVFDEESGMSERIQRSGSVKQHHTVVSQNNTSTTTTSTEVNTQPLSSAVSKQTSLTMPSTNTISTSQAQKFFMLTVDGKKVLIPSTNLTQSNPKAYVLDQRSTSTQNLPVTPNYAPYNTSQVKVNVSRSNIVAPRFTVPNQLNTAIQFPTNLSDAASKRQITIRPVRAELFQGNRPVRFSFLKTTTQNKSSSTYIPLTRVSRPAVHSETQSRPTVVQGTPTVVQGTSSLGHQLRPRFLPTQSLRSTATTSASQTSERIAVSTVITRPITTRQQTVTSSFRMSSMVTSTNSGRQTSITNFVSGDKTRTLTTTSSSSGNSVDQTSAKYFHPLINEPIISVGKSKTSKGTKYYFVPGGVIVKTETKEPKNSNELGTNSDSLKRQRQNNDGSLPPNKYQKLTHDILKSDDKIKKVQEMLDDRRKKLEEIKKRNTQ